MKQAASRPQAAVAKRRIGFELGDLLEIDAELVQCFLHLLENAEVGDRIAHEATDKKLEAEIIDALAAGFVGGAGRLHPVLDGPVAGDENGGHQPVMGLGDLRVLADAVAETTDDLAGDVFGFR